MTETGETLENFSFRSAGREVLRFAANGDIFVNGRMAKSDLEVVTALREFLTESGHLK